MLCVVLRLIQGFISFLYNCHRLCLVYNLVLPPQPSSSSGAAAAPYVQSSEPIVDGLVTAFNKWKQDKPCAERLVYMCEHRWGQIVTSGVVGC